MKKIIIISFFLILSSIAMGQKKANRLFDEGIHYFESGEFGSAANCFEQIVKKHRNYKLYDQVVYNLAYTYNEADSFDLAIKWYEHIRASKLKDDEKVWGRGLLEPYANYKNNSTFNIATILYNEKKDYEKALSYYRQSLVKYPYYNTSGTDLRIRKNKVIVYMTDCLIKLGRYEEALLVILPEAIDSPGSANYSLVVNKAMELIDTHFDKKTIKEELEVALKTLEVDKSTRTFSMKFKDTVFIFDPYFSHGNSKIAFLTEIKESGFWEELSKE